MLAGMGRCISQSALAQSGRAGARPSARRPDHEHRVLRRLRRRAGRQHRRAGARHRIFLADGTAGAQLYLYFLFPPFSEVFRIYDWYSARPYYAHLQAALNGAAAVLLVCGRLADWRANALLALAFFALFVSGLISAPFTFVFATPAYIVICAALILTRRRPPAEWAWKATALAFCLIFFFASGLLDYYLGTIATAGRTPTAPVAWDRLLSAQSWLQLFRDHALCSDSRLLLCFGNRGAWQLIAALGGAALAIVTRRGDIRTAAAAFIGYIALAHVYAYAYQTISLGPLGVLSSHFLMLSVWSFTCIFAIVPFSQAFQPFGARAAANAGSPLRDELASSETSLSPPCCSSSRWPCCESLRERALPTRTACRRRRRGWSADPGRCRA